MRDGNNGGGLTWDRSHAEADRRMRLLEMAGGDLEKAREMELWVLTGAPERVVIQGEVPLQDSDMLCGVKIVGKPGHNPFPPPEPIPLHVLHAPFDDGLDIPAFLDRRRA